jgi:hypothetical protein
LVVGATEGRDPSTVARLRRPVGAVQHRDETIRDPNRRDCCSGPEVDAALDVPASTTSLVTVMAIFATFAGASIPPAATPQMPVARPWAHRIVCPSALSLATKSPAGIVFVPSMNGA